MTIDECAQGSEVFGHATNNANSNRRVCSETAGLPKCSRRDELDFLPSLPRFVLGRWPWESGTFFGRSSHVRMTGARSPPDCGSEICHCRTFLLTCCPRSSHVVLLKSPCPRCDLPSDTWDGCVQGGEKRSPTVTPIEVLTCWLVASRATGSIFSTESLQASEMSCSSPTSGVSRGESSYSHIVTYSFREHTETVT